MQFTGFSKPVYSNAFEYMGAKYKMSQNVIAQKSVFGANRGASSVINTTTRLCRDGTRSAHLHSGLLQVHLLAVNFS